VGRLFCFYNYRLCRLEGHRIFKKNVLNIAHLPTLLLAIGYPIFWLELYLLRSHGGHTTMLAPCLFFVLVLYVLIKQKNIIYDQIINVKRNFSQCSVFFKSFIIIGSVFSIVIILCAFYASLLPPHLIQESDALNYHISIPRQHLILGSFQHISWSTADLYLLPIDFALAPFWLFTEYPNKFPQFIFSIGLLLIAMRLTRKITRNDFLCQILVVFGILGSHNVGIQLGTAMLDVILCYLLLAALDSLLDKRLFMCAIEFAFYFWSKSFVPLQVMFIVILMFFLYFILKNLDFNKIGWSAQNLIVTQGIDMRKKCRKFTILFLLISIFVAGPFLGKTLYYAGTPLYPFFPGMIQINKNIDKSSLAWKSLLSKSQKAVSTRDQYGSGRSPIEFMRHLWLIAVPEKGVNNRYDYPVGLMYLLCLGPFLSTLVRSVKDKEFLILPVFVTLFWMSWWLGSHQSRFLYVPIVLLLIVVMAQKKFHSKAFAIGVILCLVLVSLSVFRAHKSDFGKSAWDVLRKKDKELLNLSKTVKGDQVVQLSYFDIAFADFPVEVIQNNSVFVLQY